MKEIDLSNSHISLDSLLNQVVDDEDCTLVKRCDGKNVVMMPLSHFNGLMETLHLLKSPANAEHLMKSIKQYRESIDRNSRYIKNEEK